MEKSSFFNSVNGDRKYNASDWAAYFASFIGNGVFGAPDDCLQVTPGENISVSVAAGSGWINGYHYVNTEPLVLQLPTPDATLNRIDRVVLRWSLSQRSIRVIVKPGSLSDKPGTSAPQRDSDIYELVLADVYVPAGAKTLSKALITDWRYKSSYLCGNVSLIINDDHKHDDATQTLAGFMSAADKKELDSLAAKVTQDVGATADVTFKTVTADKVIGAVYA